jgi:hypothetical protein
VGSLEVICGLALTFIPFGMKQQKFGCYRYLKFLHIMVSFVARVKQGANIILVILMLMAVYSHYMVNDKFERIAPALVNILLIQISRNIKKILVSGVFLHASLSTSCGLAIEAQGAAEVGSGGSG